MCGFWIHIIHVRIYWGKPVKYDDSKYFKQGLHQSNTKRAQTLFITITLSFQSLSTILYFKEMDAFFHKDKLKSIKKRE